MNLAEAYKLLSRFPTVGARLWILLLPVVFLAITGGVYMLKLYQSTRDEIRKGGADAVLSPLLNASYAAYRFYLGLLGMGIVLLGAANISIPK